MDSELKERFFLAGQESLGGWLLRALSLHAAAARLDWKALPPREDEPTTSFIAEYTMLLGLAFENLLKGYISLVRLEAGHSPSLPNACHVHKLDTLATRVECANLALNDNEIKTLKRLSPYIEWAGRYPLPKKASEMFLQLGSTHDMEAERRLWERLVPLLRDRAWVMKGGPKSLGGHKLHMKRDG